MRAAACFCDVCKPLGRKMYFLHGHVSRCRRDRNVLFTTIGVGFYGTLAVAVLCHSAWLSLSH